MICLETVKKYCKDYTKIENYEEAKASTKKWECHHRKEIDGDIRRSTKELIMNGLYYDRPADELIFLDQAEHKKLHMSGQTYNNGKKRSEATKEKISRKLKGNNNSKGACKGRHWHLENGKRVWT